MNNNEDYTAGFEAYNDGAQPDVLHGASAAFDAGYWDAHEAASREVEVEPCLDGPVDCDGEVEYRPAMSPTGKWFPRCDKHFAERLDRQRDIVSRYGGSIFY